MSKTERILFTAIAEQSNYKGKKALGKMLLKHRKAVT